MIRARCTPWLALLPALMGAANLPSPIIVCTKSEYGFYEANWVSTPPWFSTSERQPRRAQIPTNESALCLPSRRPVGRGFGKGR